MKHVVLIVAVIKIQLLKYSTVHEKVKKTREQPASCSRVVLCPRRVPPRLPHAIHPRVRTREYTRALWFLATVFNLYNLDSDSIHVLSTRCKHRTHILLFLPLYTHRFGLQCTPRRSNIIQLGICARAGYMYTAVMKEVIQMSSLAKAFSRTSSKVYASRNL